MQIFFSSIYELIKWEVTRIIKDKDIKHESELSNPISAPCVHDMVLATESGVFDTWIVDSRALNHMCSHGPFLVI